jgi:hypothetical protein
MNKSEAIRALGREGLAVADIARRVGVRYQFARNVLLAAGLLKATRTASPRTSRADTTAVPKESRKPLLTVDELLRAGFVHSSRWQLTNDSELALENAIPAARGVYAMAKNGEVQYVGLATMGLAKRFKFYIRPGKTQRTSIRLNALLKKELGAGQVIDVYTVSPPDLKWNGLPVSGMAGLELGLIEGYKLPWNIRGVTYVTPAEVST